MVGCSDTPATAPTGATLAAPAAQVAAAQVSLADAVVRLVPGISQAGGSAELGDALGSARIAMERLDASALRSALARADVALAALASTDAAADAAAVKLAIGDAKALLGDIQ